MPTVAEQLRQARTARNLTVQQVAEILKIRTDHLAALEEGDYSVFSAPVYIRGFVRSYSTLLKLDVPGIMATLDTELGASGQFPEPPPLSDQPRGFLDSIMLLLSKVDWRKTAVVLGLAVILMGFFLAISAWRRSKAADPLSDLKPGVYQSTQALSADTLPLPPPRH